jgi:AAA+ superfamily predicted ATPase
LRPDLELRGPRAGLNLHCQKAKRTGGLSGRPLTERVTMTDITTEVHDNSESIGTLEHLDPA